jgi:signal transduction histidine kinase
VRIEYTQYGLTIQVDNGGVRVVPADQPVAGVGLLGMRERVAALGGKLQAAPRPEGGFSVRAEIPLHTKAPVK